MNELQLENIFDTEVRDGNANWKLCCPFHGETTPSFMIHKDTGQAYCWGCGWAGSVISAIQEYVGVSRDKAKSIARKQLDYSMIDAVLKKKKATNEVKYFPESWLEAWPLQIHKSVLERGFSVETLQCARTRYDRLGARQIFPHRDVRGSLLGVAGRGCRNQDPKWLFYWGYSKGRSLYYGCSQNESGLPNEAYVVEGIYDVLWFQQCGFHNTVGILGSKPSKFQLDELRKYDKVTVCMDNDVSGMAGALSLNHHLKKSTKVRFIEWPEKANDGMELKQDELAAALSQSLTPFEWKRLPRTKQLISELASKKSSSTSKNSSQRRTSPMVMQP